MENNRTRNDEPGYDYTGERRYYEELGGAEEQLEREARREQDEYERQLDQEQRERGAMAANAANETPAGQDTPADRSAEMDAAIAYARGRYGSDVLTAKYPEGDIPPSIRQERSKSGYEGYGFNPNGTERSIDDLGPGYYETATMSPEAIKALDGVIDAISRFRVAVTPKSHINGEIGSGAKLDHLQESKKRIEVVDETSIDEAKRPADTGTDDPENKE